MLKDGEYLKKAIAKLGPDAKMESLIRYAQALKEADALAEGGGEEETPAEPTAASAAPAAAPVTASGVSGAANLAPANTVQASDTPAAMAAPGAPPAEEPEPEPTMALASVDPAQLMEALSAAGVDPAMLLEAVKSRGAELLAWLTGEPAAPAAPVEPAAGFVRGEEAQRMATEKEALSLRLSALSDRFAQQTVDHATALTERETRLTEQTAELDTTRIALATARIDLAIERGHILDKQRAGLVALVSKRETQWAVRSLALDSVLEDAARTPAVPQGKRVTASGPAGAGFDAPTTPQGSVEDRRFYAAAFAYEKDPAKREALIDAAVKADAEKREKATQVAAS